MPEVIIGIGSNIKPRTHVPAALEQLSARLGPIDVSPMYRCPAVGFAGAEFVNLVAAFTTSQSIHAVQAELRELENQGGRERRVGDESRTLDLDMLLYGDTVFDNGDIRVPRADIFKYAFVCRPLAELRPAGRHPIDGRSYAQIWQAFGPSDIPLIPVQL